MLARAYACSSIESSSKRESSAPVSWLLSITVTLHTALHPKLTGGLHHRDGMAEGKAPNSSCSAPDSRLSPNDSSAWRSTPGQLPHPPSISSRPTSPSSPIYPTQIGQSHSQPLPHTPLTRPILQIDRTPSSRRKRRRRESPGMDSYVKPSPPHPTLSHSILYAQCKQVPPLRTITESTIHQK